MFVLVTLCRDDLIGNVGEGASSLGRLPNDLRRVSERPDSCPSAAHAPIDERRLLDSDGRLDLPRCLVSSPPSVLVDVRLPCRIRLTGETSASVVREPELAHLLLVDVCLRLERVLCSLVHSDGVLASLCPALYLLTLKILLKLSTLLVAMGRPGTASSFPLRLGPLACGGSATTSLQLVTVVTTVSAAVKTGPRPCRRRKT